MKLFAVYIITSDGRELLSEVYQNPKNVPNQTMLSSLLTVFQAMSADLTKNEGGATKLTLSGIVYHIRQFGGFMVVLVTNSEDIPSKVLDTIGYRFIQTHDEDLRTWMGNQTVFHPFKKQIEEVVDKQLKIDASKSIDPSKPLDTVAIFSLPKEVQSTALALTLHETATLDTIVKETELPRETVIQNLERLRKEGYIGIREKNGQEEYFAST